MPEDVKEKPQQTGSKTYKCATAEYLSTTSAHVLPALVSHKTKVQKVLWFLIFWAAMAYAFYQLKGIVLDYKRYQVTVKTLVKHRTEAEFPAVTICNENKLKKSLIWGTPYESIATLEEKVIQQNIRGTEMDSSSGDDTASGDSDDPLVNQELQDFYSYYDGHDLSDKTNDIFLGLRNEHDYEKLFAMSRTTDYSDIINFLRPNMTELDLYGHQFEDLLLQCTFDGDNCTEKDFEKSYSDAYGNCYTFNGLQKRGTPVKTTKFGSRYGLKLSLNVESDEYLGLFTHQTGARISLHPANTTPFPEDSSVAAPVGFLTEVAFDTSLVESRKSPYETNCTAGEGIPLFYPGVYTTHNCIYSCLRRVLWRNCKCVETVRAIRGETRCQISNITQVICRLNVYRKFKNNKFECQHNCNEPCVQVAYNIMTSTSQWPTQGYKALLRKQLRQLKNGTYNNEDQYLEGNILRVHVHFKTLSYSFQEAFPMYTWETLIANIGGTFGLFVGFSVCTFLEAFEYFIELIRIFIKSCCTRKPEKVTP